MQYEKESMPFDSFFAFKRNDKVMEKYFFLKENVILRNIGE